MEIGFVITNYNNSNLTKGAIESINKTRNAVFKIVVVDNASDDENVQELKKTEIEFNNLTVIYSSENVGYFKGLNIGIKYLRANYSNIDWMVIGNNDVLFPELFYMSILDKKLLLKKYPVISPNIITAWDYKKAK